MEIDADTSWPAPRAVIHLCHQLSISNNIYQIIASLLISFFYSHRETKLYVSDNRFFPQHSGRNRDKKKTIAIVLLLTYLNFWYAPLFGCILTRIQASSFFFSIMPFQ
jgi:hypothetical protein